MSERKIITEYVYPPIPVRQFDWSAHFDGDEEDGPCGRGATEEDAISDLMEQVDMAEEKMENPYTEFGKATVDRIIDGERVEVTNQPGTSERLRQFAYYMTENQNTPADAMLVMDLHTAADALKRAGK